MTSKSILIIDIETTAFMPLGKIVEIGAVALDVETGEICAVFDSLCKPEGLTVGEVRKSWIIENGYIDFDELRMARPIKEVLAEFQKTIDSREWIGATAYNRQFDFPFLAMNGITLPKSLDCPMIVATNVCKLPSVNGRPGYKWPKVEEAWKVLIGTEYTERHRGCDDAMHEAQIVWKLIELGHFKI